VPYEGGGPALRDLIAGRVDMMFEPMSASIGPIRAGLAARALAGDHQSAPSEALPDVPTLGDVVPGYEGQRRDRCRRAPQTRRLRSSIVSTRRSMPPYADPKMKGRGLRTRAAACYQAHPPSSAQSSPEGKSRKWAEGGQSLRHEAASEAARQRLTKAG